MKILNILAVILLTFSHSRVLAVEGETELSFTSSPDDTVGQGKPKVIVPDKHVRFMVGPSDKNGISVATFDSETNEMWVLIVTKSPKKATIIGPNPGAVNRHDKAHAFISFGRSGKGYKKVTGAFTVIEISWDAAGQIVSLALDFQISDVEKPGSWLKGSVRINSVVPTEDFKPTPPPKPFEKPKEAPPVIYARSDPYLT